MFKNSRKKLLIGLCLSVMVSSVIFFSYHTVKAFESANRGIVTASAFVQPSAPVVMIKTPLEVNIAGCKIYMEAGISAGMAMESLTFYYKKVSEPETSYKLITKEFTPPLFAYTFKDYIPGEVVTTDGVMFYFEVTYSGEVGVAEVPAQIITVNPSVTMTIGPEGGTIVLVDGNPEDGEVCIEIPAGALESEIEITFSQKDPAGVPAGFGVAGSDSPLAAYEILPENIDFQLPYNLTLLYFDLNGEVKEDGTLITEEELKILWWDGFDWRLVGGTLNSELNTLTTSLNHNSIFAVFPALINERTHCPLERIITPACQDGINDYAYFNGLTDLDNVSIKIYDITGKEIRTINITPYQWDGRNNDGDIVESGVYIYQCEYNGKNVSGVIVVAK
ncbi:gliding motility-associated C-terminal domain-containing protein [bacterium]|nr:gliding motility-associated C-terminal domain-containing protein [bacterium]